MHQSHIQELSNCFPAMIAQIKSQSLVPFLDLVFSNLQENGFTNEEILFAIEELIHCRGLEQEQKKIFGGCQCPIKSE